MSEESKRWKQVGRSGVTFIQIPHFVLRSEKWAALSGSAMKLLMELAAQYVGKNNGDLSVTFNTMQSRGWSSNATFRRALNELEECGWIVKTRQGGRHVGCNLYGITWWPIDDGKGKHQHPMERKPSHLWKNAVGRTETGPRKDRNWTAKGLGVQKLDCEIVPLRPVA